MQNPSRGCAKCATVWLGLSKLLSACEAQPLRRAAGRTEYKEREVWLGGDTAVDTS